MVEKFLVFIEALTIGLLISIGAAVFLVVFGPYFIFAIFAFVQTVLPLTVIGALIGKCFTKNHVGTLCGAGLGVIFGYGWLFSITTNLPLD